MRARRVVVAALGMAVVVGLALAAGMQLSKPGGGTAGGRTAAPPSLVLVSIDTLRADHVGCYGYPRPTTPVLDRFAADGHLFRRAYSVMPTTLPSHAAMFTGRYPTETTVRRNGDRLPAEAVTLAEVLHQAGFATAAFVSSPVMSTRYGLDQGFAVYAPTNHSLPAEKTVAAALSWLRAERSRPLFLFVHLFDPHRPYQAPAAFRERFGAPDRPLPPAFQFVDDPAQFTPSGLAEIVNAYDAEIAYADASLAPLLDETRDFAVTIVVSDHGETLGDLLSRWGYAFDHGEFLYRHQLQVPLVARLPPALAGRRGVPHEVPVSLVDLRPTVLDLLSVADPAPGRGRSLRPLLEGGTLPPTTLYAERRAFARPLRPFLAGEGRSAVDWPWQLITNDRLEPELYDLAADPDQLRNLAVPESSQAGRLHAAIESWQRETRALWAAFPPEQDPEALERLRALGYVQ